MEILLALSTGLLLGYLLGIAHLPHLAKKYENGILKHWAGMEDYLHEVGLKAHEIVNGKEEGAIIHPIPLNIKKEQKKTQEAKDRGEEYVPLDQL